MVQPLVSCLIMFHLQLGRLQAPLGCKGLGGCTAGGWSRDEAGTVGSAPPHLEMQSACGPGLPIPSPTAVAFWSLSLKSVRFFVPHL